MSGENWQEAKTQDAIRLTDHINKPIEGYYLGKRKVATKEYGEQLIHKFKKTDGTILEFWGFDLMNRLLDAVPINCLTRVTCTGKEKSKKNPDNEFYNCKVLFDSTKTISDETQHTESNKNDDLPF